MKLLDLYEKQRLKVNILRLLLAVLVVWSHSFPLGDFGGDPLLVGFPGTSGTISVGTFAIAGFFSLSGFVVTRSALMTTPASYVISRFLRIWPAYALALVVTAFLFMPLILALNGALEPSYFSFAPGGPFTYVARNALLPIDLQWAISGGPTGVPYEGSINGSLWTLPVEIRAYGLSLLLVILGAKLGLRRVFIVALIGLVLIIVGKNSLPDVLSFVTVQSVNPELLFVFIAAGFLATFDRSFLVGKLTVFLSAFMLLCGLSVPNASLGLMCLACLSILLPGLLSFWQLRVPEFFANDYSFGLYIYAFPIQQLVASLGFLDSPVTFFCVSLGIASIFAVASWHLIEKPSLALKKFLLGRSP